MPEIILYKSKWKAIRLMLLSLPFVITGLFLIYKNRQDGTLDWICVCFFGLGIPMGLFNFFDRRPQIIINEAGVFDRNTTKEFVEWNFIKDAYLKEVRITLLTKQQFLCLVLDPEAPIFLKVSKRLLKFSESLGFKDISIVLNNLEKTDWQKLVSAIKKMTVANISERKNLLLTTQL